jgi:glycerol-3-phosphate dehydrogenase
VCAAEIVAAVEDEMARTLEDVLRRCPPLLAAAGSDADRLARLAEVVGELVGWSMEQRRAEQVALEGRAGAFDGGDRSGLEVGRAALRG